MLSSLQHDVMHASAHALLQKERAVTVPLLLTAQACPQHLAVVQQPDVFSLSRKSCQSD
jgi:hypothetical protein